MKKALITGVAGFAGSHLSQYLISKNIEVTGFFHPKHTTQNVDHLRGKINLIACDVLQKKDVEDKIKKIKPGYVFHLAAFSSPSQSFNNPKETLENNIFGQINLLEALVKINSKAKILIVGSADEYGEVSSDHLPIKEDTPLAPTSPYAVSKVTQDLLGYQFYLSDDLNIVRVRPFNHIGPRQAPIFVVSSFALQIANLEKLGGGIMKVGNLKSARDFTDVRDMVKAYLLALDEGKKGDVYNIGSGHAVKIGEILKMMLSLSSANIQVVEDPELLRPTEIFYCDYSKFKKRTSWQPLIPLETTLSDTINYERERLGILH